MKNNEKISSRNNNNFSENSVSANHIVVSIFNLVHLVHDAVTIEFNDAFEKQLSKSSSKISFFSLLVIPKQPEMKINTSIVKKVRSLFSNTYTIHFTVYRIEKDESMKIKI